MRKHSLQLRTPIQTKPLNLSSIPDSIRTEAIINCNTSVGPKQKFRSISTHRNSEIGDVNNSFKAKKVEDISTIINRVVRKNCCLKPQNPEDVEMMRRVVGDGSDYY